MQLVRGAIKLPQRQIIRGSTPCVSLLIWLAAFSLFCVSSCLLRALRSGKLPFVKCHVMLRRYTRSRNPHEMTQEQRNVVGYFDAVVKLESKAADLYRMFQNLLQKSNDHRSTRREFEGAC